MNSSAVYFSFVPDLHSQIRILKAFVLKKYKVFYLKLNKASSTNHFGEHVTVGADKRQTGRRKDKKLKRR